MRESKIEAYLAKEIKRIGGKCIKMVPTFESGIPDRQVLYKSRAIFIELKAEGKKPRKLQVKYMQELQKAGFETLVIDSKKAVDVFVNRLKLEA